MARALDLGRAQPPLELKSSRSGISGSRLAWKALKSKLAGGGTETNEGQALEMGGQRVTPQSGGTSFIEQLLSGVPFTRGCTLAVHRSNSGHKHGFFEPPHVFKKLELVFHTYK